MRANASAHRPADLCSQCRVADLSGAYQAGQAAGGRVDLGGGKVAGNGQARIGR